MVGSPMRCWILALTTAFAASACDKPSSGPASTPPQAAAEDDTSSPAEGAAPPVEDEATAEPEEPGSEGLEPDDGDAGLGPAAETASTDPVEVPEDPAEGLTEPTSFATVKMEIRTPDGKVFRDNGKVIRWDQLTRIPIDFEAKQHEFIVEVKRSGKKATIELSYVLDGTDVVRNVPIETKIGKRELLRIDDGTALAVTIGTKTIKPKPPSQQKIETPKGNQPLTGVDAKSKK
jgi:hypothetical protein